MEEEAPTYPVMGRDAHSGKVSGIYLFLVKSFPYVPKDTTRCVWAGVVREVILPCCLSTDGMAGVQAAILSFDESHVLAKQSKI